MLPLSLGSRCRGEEPSTCGAGSPWSAVRRWNRKTAETRVRQRCEEQGPVSSSFFPELGMSGDIEAESPFFGEGGDV